MSSRRPTLACTIQTLTLVGLALLASGTLPAARAQFPPPYTDQEFLFILTSEADYSAGNHRVGDLRL